MTLEHTNVPLTRHMRYTASRRVWQWRSILTEIQDIAAGIMRTYVAGIASIAITPTQSRRIERNGVATCCIGSRAGQSPSQRVPDKHHITTCSLRYLFSIANRLFILASSEAQGLGNIGIPIQQGEGLGSAGCHVVYAVMHIDRGGKSSAWIVLNPQFIEPCAIIVIGLGRILCSDGILSSPRFFRPFLSCLFH